MKTLAFTLVELLIVIAIIATLAALLFPVFARSKTQAQVSTCASNVRQSAVATLMYMSDSDDQFPAGEEQFVKLNPEFYCPLDPSVCSSGGIIESLLLPYLKTGKTFH